MRHLYVVVDGSRTMEDQDLKPNRLTCTLKVFIFSKCIHLHDNSESVPVLGRPLADHWY